ncbi:MAG TPA: aminopeptidase, partial [Vitreoscilla sp.]|nr:aminopeptidase [Vitreoscilla sp.]
MKFSIISEKNQLEQNAAHVWVGIKGEKQTPAVAANLLAALQNGLDVEADVDSACGLDVNAGQLNAVAVLQVVAGASRAKLEKHALKIAQYVVEQKAQAVSIDVCAVDAATQALLVDVLVLAFSQAVYRFDEHKRDAKA